MKPSDLLAKTGAEAAAGVPHLASLAGKRVLVTGATGLIGRVVVAALRSLPEDQQPALIACADHKWHIGNALAANADVILHGAGYAQPAKFMRDPLGTIDVNTNWTLKLAKALKPDGRMLFLSSSEVCNGSNSSRHLETDIGNTSPEHHRAAYIEGKRCGEAIIHAARLDGRQVMAARVSLAYGPGTRRGDSRVMSEFISRALTFGEIVLQDGGQARRTYCYITDVVEMLLNILLRGRHAIYNVGGEGETTVLSLARKIADKMKVNCHAPRGLGNLMHGAPAHVALDLGRYKREFGKQLFVPLDEGLDKTIAWHRALQEAPEGVAA